MTPCPHCQATRGYEHEESVTSDEWTLRCLACGGELAHGEDAFTLAAAVATIRGEPTP
jgi:hypothetical protein